MPPPPAAPPAPPLNVVIVGAGIGGLSAATAFRRAGHNVSIYEQSAFSNELGAAIHLGPNASRILGRYGYDEKRLRGVRCDSLEMMAPDGTTMFKALTDHVTKEYGSPWYLCHRVDLHNELKHLAFDEEGEGKPATLHLSSKVVGVDLEKGQITLAGGEVAQGDLIVGADGIHSRIRDHIIGEGYSPPPSGSNTYRFMIPVSSLTSDPLLSAYVPSPTKPGMKIVVARDKRLVFYPCRDSTLLNGVGIHPDTLSKHSTEEWNANTCTVEDLKQTYADFAPVYHRLFEVAEDIKLWQLKDRGGIDTWIKGRGCLLGDACHPMLPHQGQGGGQAIEDGAALGVIFPLGTPAADVPTRLAYYEHVRKSRAETIQEFSRAQIAGSEKQVIDPRVTEEFTFRHDVVAYAKEALTAVWIPSTVAPRGPPAGAPGGLKVRPLAGVELPVDEKL